MLEKLEEVKKLGSYSINFYFGEGEGCDDSDIPMNERKIRLICSPVGYLGSMRVLYNGTVKSFLDFDFKSEPKVLSNPPLKKDIDNDGFYCWGSESAISIYKENKKLFPFS